MREKSIDSVKNFNLKHSQGDLLRNFMNFSRHQKQHLQRQRRTFTGPLSAPFSLSLSSMYWMAALIDFIMAIMSEPNARVPE